MNRKIFDYLEMAGRLAQSKDDGRSFLLGAVGIRGLDGVMVSAINSITERPDRKIHAEYRLCKKLTPRSIIYIARFKLDNTGFGMAKPCKNCQKVIRSRGVLRVYYTIDNETFGIWQP